MDEFKEGLGGWCLCPADRQAAKLVKSLSRTETTGNDEASLPLQRTVALFCPQGIWDG